MYVLNGEKKGAIKGKQKREKYVLHSFKYSILIYVDDLIERYYKGKQDF